MTAEIGMLNKYAVALAADSAVTVSGGNGDTKVFNSANKLFKLSNTEPVGIMVYGSADYMGIPWETVIKLFRKTINGKKYDYVSEYANAFLKYIRFFEIPNENEDSFLRTKIFNLIDGLLNDLEKDSEMTLSQWVAKVSPIVSAEEKNGTLGFFNRMHYNKIYKNYIIELFIDFSEKEQYKKYNFKVRIDKDINTAVDEVLSLFFDYLESSISMRNSSGIVIAGFGEKEIYPSLYQYDIEGCIKKCLFMHEKEAVKISRINDASIQPFAQTNMVMTFLTGINPIMQENIGDFVEMKVKELAGGISKSLTETYGISENESDDFYIEVKTLIEANFKSDYYKFLQEYKRTKHIMPVLNTVASLGKDDLAAMAESLVNITSIDKKMSMNLESVGGPIDVAIISKGDGFIWYKRKHYFDAALNPDFIARKGK